MAVKNDRQVSKFIIQYLSNKDTSSLQGVYDKRFQDKNVPISCVNKLALLSASWNREMLESSVPTARITASSRTVRLQLCAKPNLRRITLSGLLCAKDWMQTTAHLWECKYGDGIPGYCDGSVVRYCTIFSARVYHNHTICTAAYYIPHI